MKMKKTEIKKVVKERYGDIIRQGATGCGPVSSSPGEADFNQGYLENVGYSSEELRAVPEGTIGFGCGNPVALASLREGETVLDLGSGAGFDCFLAADKVGKDGKVIGVDMTPEMIRKAGENAVKGNYGNIEFRLGEIEHLPVADDSVDVVISNCVINLSPDKKAAFKEAYRVLRPGGRLMVSDIVLLAELPSFIRNSVDAYVGCVSGAILKEDYMKAVRDAGFQEIKIMDERPFPAIDLGSNFSLSLLATAVTSIKVFGVKKRRINRRKSMNDGRNIAKKRGAVGR